jgi:protein-disulfide isomerase
MASGKKSRQRRTSAAGAPPPVRSKGAPGRRQASPRVLAAGAALVVLVVVGIVLGVVFSGGSKATNGSALPTNGSISEGLPGASDINSMFKGIPQRGLVLGSPSAHVTLTEYIDLQCPYCQQFETTVMPDIVSSYVKTGKVKVEARPLAFIGPDSVRGRNAMIAAGDQRKAFNLAELLYVNQGTENTGWLSDTMIANAARSIPGLNPRLLFSVRNSSSVKAQATQIDAEGKANSVNQTPTLYVGAGGKLGSRVTLGSPTDKASLTTALDAALAS